MSDKLQLVVSFDDPTVLVLTKLKNLLQNSEA
jgi:hypothetical protein